MKTILLASVAALAVGGFAFAGEQPSPVKGLGNCTASTSPGKGNNTTLAYNYFNSSNWIGSNAEEKSGKGPSSDVGEGRERADQVNGTNGSFYVPVYCAINAPS